MKYVDVFITHFSSTASNAQALAFDEEERKDLFSVGNAFSDLRVSMTVETPPDEVLRNISVTLTDLVSKMQPYIDDEGADSLLLRCEKYRASCLVTPSRRVGFSRKFDSGLCARRPSFLGHPPLSRQGFLVVHPHECPPRPCPVFKISNVVSTAFPYRMRSRHATSLQCKYARRGLAGALEATRGYRRSTHAQRGRIIFHARAEAEVNRPTVAEHVRDGRRKAMSTNHPGRQQHHSVRHERCGCSLRGRVGCVSRRSDRH